MAVALAIGGFVQADDTASLKAEMAAVQSQLAAMEARQDSGSEKGPDHLVSMQKNAKIKIGGSLEMAVHFVNRDGRTFDTSGTASDFVNATSTPAVTQVAARSNTGGGDYQTNRIVETASALEFRAYADKNSYVHIKLDLDDQARNTPAVGAGELVEEAYFMWKDINCSKFSIRFGKQELPWLQDWDKMLTGSYIHAGTDGGYLGGALANSNENVVGTGSSTGSVFTQESFSRFGIDEDDFFGQEEDNTYAITGIWELNKQWKFEASLFQDDRSLDATTGHTDGKSNDDLTFNSLAGRITWTPTEKLSFVLSGIRRHNEAASKFPSPDSEDHMLGSGIGFTWHTSDCNKSYLFGEWVHLDNAQYDDGQHSNSFQLGYVWDVTKKLDLVLLGEYMFWTNDTQAKEGLPGVEEQIWKIAPGAWYKLDSGITLKAEWIHEEYDRNVPNNFYTGDLSATSDALVLGATYKF